MVDAIVTKIAYSIKRANPDETASIDVLKYSLNLIINPLAIISLSTTIGLLFGQLSEIYTILFSFALLRTFSGGRHLKSSDACIFLTTGLATVLSYVELQFLWNLCLTIASFILIMVYAPYSTHRTTLIPEKYNPLLKVISGAIVSINFFFFSSLLSVAFFLQALTLINSLRKGVSRE